MEVLKIQSAHGERQLGLHEEVCTTPAVRDTTQLVSQLLSQSFDSRFGSVVCRVSWGTRQTLLRASVDDHRRVFL
jgi:hypothetical protein